MQLRLTLIWLVLFLASKSLESEANPSLINRAFHPVNCKEVTANITSNVTAYLDWEFTLNCKDLKLQLMNYSESTLVDSTSQCFVKGESYADYNASTTAIRLSSLTANQLTYNVTLVFGAQCLWKSVTVHLKELPVASCAEDTISHVTRDVNVHHVQINTHAILNLICAPAPNAGEDFIPPPAVPSSEYSTQWYFRKRIVDGDLIGPCKKLEDVANDHQIIRTTHPDRPTDVRRTNINFYHPGVYSCAVSYQNRTVYITHYSVCVQKKVIEGQPSLICQQEKSFYQGETITFECSAEVSMGKIDPNQLKITWSQVGSNSSHEICTNSNLTVSSTSTVDPRLTCHIEEYVNRELKCYSYEPADSELLGDNKAPQMKLLFTIRNVRKSDAGSYSVRMLFKGHLSDLQKMTLKFDPRLEMEWRVMVLVSALVVLLTVLIVAGVVWYNRVQIKLFIRRHNGKYDKDDKKFVVIFAYLCSTEMSNQSRENTKKIVAAVKDRLKEMNYEYYDSGEEYDPGFQVSVLLRYLDQSHRMVIILTEEFVNETWGRFIAQQGFYNMLKNETKLIFIRAPKAEKALRKLSDKQHNFTKELRESMKACRNIKWKPTMNERRFQDSVQYALPKLLRDQGIRCVPRYQRMDTTLSTQTTLCDVPPTPNSPGSDGYHFQAFADANA